MPESSVLHYKKISTLETYSEPCQISKMQCFAKIVDGFYPLTIFLKHSFLDVWQGFEYASEKYISFPNKKKNYPTPADIYLLKVNKRNTRTSCEICSELKIKTPRVLLSLLLTLNIFHTFLVFL